jgi:hypothetical protein
MHSNSNRAGTGVDHCLTHNRKVLCGNNRACLAISFEQFDASTEPKCKRCEAKRAAMLTKKASA